MENIKIERIESIQTLEECAELLVEAYNAEPWKDNWTKDKALEKLACFYNSPKFLGLVAVQENKFLGCCVGNIEPYYTGDYYYLKEMFVTTSFQNKGVGSLLMTTLKEHLESIDIKTIFLFTANDLFPFDFYIKTGFHEMQGMRMMHFGQDE